MRRPSRVPFHVVMVIVCFGVFAGQRLLPAPDLYGPFSLDGPAVTGGQLWRLVSYAFLHANLFHLATNMLSLWALGHVLEPLVRVGGRRRFAALYVLSLLGGAAGALAVDFPTPVVGASGAIFGLLGAAVSLPYRCGFGANRLGALPWLAGNLALTFASERISVGGHLGGLVAGLVCGWVFAPCGKLELRDTRRKPSALP